MATFYMSISSKPYLLERLWANTVFYEDDPQVMTTGPAHVGKRYFSLEWDQTRIEWAGPMKPPQARKARVSLWARKYAAKCRARIL
jgi:hypothetical protein